MNVQFKPRDGLLILIFMKILWFISFPLDYLHGFFKKQFSLIFPKRLNWKGNEIDGLYIELWVLFWTLINIMVVLPLLGKTSLNVFPRLLIIIILFVRAADFLRSFLAMNLNLIKIEQRSLARSFAMLLLHFFEVGAIFSSLQFIVCRQISFTYKFANWTEVFYYTLRNMVTVGGGDYCKIVDCCANGNRLLLILRIAQPIFSILLVTIAISQIINWKKSSE